MSEYPVTLIFDTETSGFPERDVPLHDAMQPKIVQLAFILIGSDRSPIIHFSTPIYWGDEHPADNEATKIHKKSAEHCKTYGVNPMTAFNILFDALGYADRAVAHNVAFDLMMLKIFAAQKYGTEMADKIPALTKFYCTMESLTPVLKIEPMRYGKYRWPKLSDAYLWATHGGEIKNAHDAMQDVRACATVLDAIEREGIRLLAFGERG